MVRMLRPLRLIARHGGMKLIVNALLQTLPHVASVLLICLLFLVVFGILGVQLFGGRFYACNDEAITTREACTGEYYPDGHGSAPEPRVWANPKFGSFDSLPDASLLLFEMQGLEGWPDVMFSGIDAVDVGIAPIRNHNPAAALYFMTWIVVGAFFILNLFIGVIVDRFDEIKKTEDGLKIMTPEQQQWVHAQYLMLRASAITRAARPLGGRRAPLYDLVTHPAFEPAVMALIVMNSLCMAVDSYERPGWLAEALDVSNQVFVAAFTLEAALKLSAFTPQKYLANGWNVFDLLVVSGSLADLLISQLAAFPVSPMLLRVLRLFRVARVLRVIRSGSALRVLLHTLVQSLPSLSNVVVLLALLLFIFAVLGTHLFCKVRGGEYIDRYANFSSLPIALLTLFRCATGESWNGIMHDLMDGVGCAERNGPGCASWAAVPFFTTYTLTSTFVTLNIVIAIILDNFSEGEQYNTRLVRAREWLRC
jgi:hypothetical protein